jgi:HlyD family secretion protein
VDEADGLGEVGKASFTVSASPSRRYPATINRVAFGSTKTDNVVTYTTTLEVDNADQSLRPGMTAAATIVSTERNGVLLVPNTALRFSPTAASASTATASSSSILSKMMPRPQSSGARKTAKTNGDAPGAKQIWILKDGQPVATPVKTGISDGRNTEVTGEGLSEGMAVITDQRTAGTAP